MNQANELYSHMYINVQFDLNGIFKKVTLRISKTL